MGSAHNTTCTSHFISTGGCQRQLVCTHPHPPPATTMRPSALRSTDPANYHASKALRGVVSRGSGVVSGIDFIYVFIALALLAGTYLHSSTFRLIASAFCGIGGALRGCLGRASEGIWGYMGVSGGSWGHLGVCRVYFVSETAQVE